MLYPRTVKEGIPITDEQLVGSSEHLMNNHRMCFLSGQFVGSMDAHNYLLALDSLSHKPIKIIITSPGGDLDSTFLLYDTIKLIKSPVYTLGRYSVSAAALILAAGDKRYLLPHAKTMLHLLSGQLSGDSHDIEIQHQQIQIYKEKLVSILQECGVKGSYKEILLDIDRDKWLEPEEAIAYGLADKIMDKKTLGRWLS